MKRIVKFTIHLFLIRYIPRHFGEMLDIANENDLRTHFSIYLNEPQQKGMISGLEDEIIAYSMTIPLFDLAVAKIKSIETALKALFTLITPPMSVDARNTLYTLIDTKEMDLLFFNLSREYTLEIYSRLYLVSDERFKEILSIMQDQLISWYWENGKMHRLRILL